MQDEKTFSLEDLGNSDLPNELSQHRQLRVSINNRQAERLKIDWTRFGAYKQAYANGHRKKGLFLSFVWMISNIITSIRYGPLERVSDLYYEYSARLQPVEFAQGEGDTQVVIFRMK